VPRPDAGTTAWRPVRNLTTAQRGFEGDGLVVNPPREQKWVSPRYQDLAGNEVALLSSHDGGALLRLIAGDLAGHGGPGSTSTPTTVVHASVSPEGEVALPWPPQRFNAPVYVLAGRGTVGTERRPVRTGQLAVLGQDDAVTVDASAGSQEGADHRELLHLARRRAAPRAVGRSPRSTARRRPAGHGTDSPLD
jgi:redox-sensitive bicupin YhaK (pirin superfamily)